MRSRLTGPECLVAAGVLLISQALECDSGEDFHILEPDIEVGKECTWQAVEGATFLPEYAQGTPLAAGSLATAKVHCEALGVECAGITLQPCRWNSVVLYSLRAQAHPHISPQGETSWLKRCVSEELNVEDEVEELSLPSCDEEPFSALRLATQEFYASGVVNVNLLMHMGTVLRMAASAGGWQHVAVACAPAVLQTLLLRQEERMFVDAEEQKNLEDIYLEILHETIAGNASFSLTPRVDVFNQLSQWPLQQGFQRLRRLREVGKDQMAESVDFVLCFCSVAKSPGGGYPVVEAEFSSYQRMFISYAHILFMARCFLSLKYQPRLAIITSTLQVSTVDLLHFLIVLVPTWFGFAIAGMIMFGRRMQAFSTPLTGFAMCLQLAMEGEYDWQGMSSEDWFITLLWVWIYMVLLVMVMLNMVLAIIMDVYAEVRREQGETMSMFQHCTYLFKRAYYYKNWVPDRELWERVAEMPETLIVDDILEAYPDMPQFQLNFMCDGARNRTRVIQRKGIDPTWTVQMVAAIHISLEEIMADLVKLKRRGWMGKGFQVRNDEDRNYVKEILAGISVQTRWMTEAQKHVSWLHEQIGVVEEDAEDWKPMGSVDVPALRSRQGND